MNAQTTTTAPTYSTLVGYCYTGSDELHFSTMSDDEVGGFLANHRRAIGTAAYPMNWRELGSSAKDVWLDIQMGSIRRTHERNLRERADREGRRYV